MRICVEALTGRTRELELSVGVTVSEFHARVCDLGCSPPEHFPFEFAGVLLECDPHVLSEEKRLSEFGVCDEAVVRQGYPRRDFGIVGADTDYKRRLEAAHEWARRVREPDGTVLRTLQARLADAALEPDTILFVEGAPLFVHARVLERSCSTFRWRRVLLDYARLRGAPAGLGPGSAGGSTAITATRLSVLRARLTDISVASEFNGSLCEGSGPQTEVVDEALVIEDAVRLMRRARAARREWLATLDAERCGKMLRLPLLLLPPEEEEAGEVAGVGLGACYGLTLPRVGTEHVVAALHAAYNLEEIIRHRGDFLVSVLHWFFRFGVCDKGTLARLQEALHASPSLACIGLARRYGYCQQPLERCLLDFEQFLVYLLSTFSLDELSKFHGYTAHSYDESRSTGIDRTRLRSDDTVAAEDVQLDEETKLLILDRRIRELEILQSLQQGQKMDRLHGGATWCGSRVPTGNPSVTAASRHLFRGRDRTRLLRRTM